MNFLGQGFQKSENDRHTDRYDRDTTMPHLWVITKICQFSTHSHGTDVNLTQCFSTAQILLFKNSLSCYFSQPFAVQDILDI